MKMSYSYPGIILAIFVVHNDKVMKDPYASQIKIHPSKVYTDGWHKRVTRNKGESLSYVISFIIVLSGWPGLRTTGNHQASFSKQNFGYQFR